MRAAWFEETIMTSSVKNTNYQPLMDGYVPIQNKRMGTIYGWARNIRAASNSAYSGCPELWILRYPAHRYHAVLSPGFEPTTLWLRVRRPNHSATTLHNWNHMLFLQVGIGFR
jgi:hypothetical protein